MKSVSTEHTGRRCLTSRHDLGQLTGCQCCRGVGRFVADLATKHLPRQFDQLSTDRQIALRIDARKRPPRSWKLVPVARRDIGDQMQPEMRVGARGRELLQRLGRAEIFVFVAGVANKGRVLARHRLAGPANQPQPSGYASAGCCQSKANRSPHDAVWSLSAAA